MNTILSKDEHNSCKRAVGFFGTKSQLVSMMEECGELICATAKYYHKSLSPEEVISEMVEVNIMLQQLKILFERRIGVHHF